MSPISLLEDDDFDINALFHGGDDQEKNLETDSDYGETKYPVSQHQATHHHQVTEGRLITTQPDAEKTEHSVSQCQANHDQALDDEKRKRKRLNDKNHREKKKQNSEKKELELQAANRKVKDLESALQASNRKVKDFERKEELWNEERNSKDQKIGRLQSKVKRLKEDGVGVEEILKELRGVKTEFHKLKGVHASTIVEEDMSKERLRREENYTKQLHLKTREDTYNSIKEIGEQQDLLVKMFLGECPMKQKKLGQEDNEKLGLVGDEHPITARDMQELKSMMIQLSQRVDALETPNPLSQAPCTSVGHRRFSSSNYDPQDRSNWDGKNV